MAQGNCHECRFSARVRRGDYADVPWEKTPCAACLARNGENAVASLEQGHGRILSYDDGLGGWMRTVAGGGYGRRKETDEGMADAMELLRAFCVGLVGSSALQRRLLLLHLEGRSKAEAARILGRSRQAIERIWFRIARRCFSRFKKERA